MRQAHSDIVRVAQEIVELSLKAALRTVGIDPPRWHDVAPVLVEHASAFPDWLVAELPRVQMISAWLRRERELAFYGDVDVIPDRAYGAAEAERAREDATSVHELVVRLVAERTES